MRKHQPKPRTIYEAGTNEADRRAPEPIDPTDRDAVASGLADMRAGRVAKPSEVDAVYAEFGRPAR